MGKQRKIDVYTICGGVILGFSNIIILLHLYITRECRTFKHNIQNWNYIVYIVIRQNIIFERII